MHFPKNFTKILGALGISFSSNEENIFCNSGNRLSIILSVNLTVFNFRFQVIIHLLISVILINLILAIFVFIFSSSYFNLSWCLAILILPNNPEQSSVLIFNESFSKRSKILWQSSLNYLVIHLYSAYFVSHTFIIMSPLTCSKIDNL
jgi:hypothetical protein